MVDVIYEILGIILRVSSDGCAAAAIVNRIQGKTIEGVWLLCFALFLRLLVMDDR